MFLLQKSRNAAFSWSLWDSLKVRSSRAVLDMEILRLSERREAVADPGGTLLLSLELTSLQWKQLIVF